jgi:nicotinamide-nucleotide amidase
MSQLTELLKQKLLTIAVAESCTGGNLSVLLTEESGSSDYFDRGFITYSDQAKIELLGVKRSTLDAYGAVSEQTALEMVEGVIQNSNANIGVSITGIAGPKHTAPSHLTRYHLVAIPMDALLHQNPTDDFYPH